MRWTIEISKFKFEEYMEFYPHKSIRTYSIDDGKAIPDHGIGPFRLRSEQGEDDLGSKPS